jgi:hypothetical protein
MIWVDLSLVVPLGFCLRECNPWVRTPLTWTSLPPGYHKNHLIWVHSSLIVFFELGLRLLVSDNKDQPPLPDREPSNLGGLDQDDPPWLCAICPLSVSRFPTNPSYSHLNITRLKWRFYWLYGLFYCLYCVLYIVHLFCISIHSISFWDSVIQIFFVELFVLDCCQLLLLLFIILILEIYSRYFDPITRNLNP